MSAIFRKNPVALQNCADFAKRCLEVPNMTHVLFSVAQVVHMHLYPSYILVVAWWMGCLPWKWHFSAESSLITKMEPQPWYTMIFSLLCSRHMRQWDCTPGRTSRFPWCIGCKLACVCAAGPLSSQFGHSETYCALDFLEKCAWKHVIWGFVRISFRGCPEVSNTSCVWYAVVHRAQAWSYWF